MRSNLMEAIDTLLSNQSVQLLVMVSIVIGIICHAFGKKGFIR